MSKLLSEVRGKNTLLPSKIVSQFFFFYTFVFFDNILLQIVYFGLDIVLITYSLLNWLILTEDR